MTVIRKLKDILKPIYCISIRLLLIAIFIIRPNYLNTYLAKFGFPNKKQKIKRENDLLNEFKILTPHIDEFREADIFVKEINIDVGLDKKLKFIINSDPMIQRENVVYCTSDFDIIQKYIKYGKQNILYIIPVVDDQLELNQLSQLQNYLQKNSNSKVLGCGCCAQDLEKNTKYREIYIIHNFKVDEIQLGSALMSILALSTMYGITIHNWNQYRPADIKIRSIIGLAKSFNRYSYYRRFDPKGVYSCAILNWVYANRINMENKAKFDRCAIIDEELFLKYEMKTSKLLYKNVKK